MNPHDTLVDKYRADHARKPDIAAARAQSEARQRLTRFENAHPTFVAWWQDAQPGSFEHSLRSYVLTHGQLTERQHAAAIGAIERKRAAPTMDVTQLTHVFAVALKNGIKRPKMRLGGVVFSLGKQNTTHENTIFVNDKERNYLGRIIASKFQPGQKCDQQLTQAIVKLGEDPMEAAVAYGRVTGECAICGRRLDNADSIARGVGPICFEKVFG